MAFDTFKRLVDDFTELKHLHLQGLGEPLMHPRFFDMVSYAASQGVKVTTNTNLTLLNERKAESCVTSGLAIVHVSLDAATAGVYESIRIRAHFERVIENIRRLNAAKARLEAELPELRMVMVLMRRNLGELPELVRLANELGIVELSVQQLCHDFSETTLPPHYAPMRTFIATESLSEDCQADADRVFAEARVLASELGLKLRLPNMRRERDVVTRLDPRCDWPWTGAYVSYDGYSMPCCMISTPDRGNFGRIDQASISEIWSGEAYEAFRAGLQNGTPPNICAACAIYKGTF